MDYLHERIRHAIETQYDANAESSLHTHSVSTADVIKAVKRLKTDKYNDDGIITSNNFQHGTSLLYTRIAQLFFCYVMLRLCTPIIFTFHNDTHTQGRKSLFQKC